MSAVLAPLLFAARHGRALLVAGLLAGVAMPGLALAMKPWLPELVGALLFLAALRIGPRQALGAARDLPMTLGFALLCQLVLPVAAILAAAAAGWQAAAPITALALMLAASSISGSPNLAILTGNDPAPALRVLILGTAILPLTVIPVFWLMPALGTGAQVFTAAGRLMAVIALAAGAAFAIRALLPREPEPQAIRALDGLSAIAMAVVVIGLMSAVGPALTQRPGAFAAWLAFAFAINFGFQLAAFALLAGAGPARAALSIVAGNRNIALFLAALPASVTDPLLLFIGCYQIPMYLTPLLLGRLYGRTANI